MAKTKQQKEKTVTDLIAKLQKSKAIVFVNFDKLRVKEVEEFRKKCRVENLDYLVAKKTLLKLAFKQAGVSGGDPKTLNKGIATIFSYEDEVTPAKTVQNFAKDHEAMLAVGGIVEGQYFDRTKILALSKLPTKLELLAKVVGSISSPISGLVNVFAGNLRNLVYILNAVKQKNS